MFTRVGDSHQHSLETLNALYEYDDFMSSIGTLVDLGCGNGDDLEWWATRTTRDDNPIPLNIQCTGVDLQPTLPVSKKYRNIIYRSGDFENEIIAPPSLYDVLWCHDSFQYAINPLKTLSNWWHIASPGAMLVIIVPQTTNFRIKQMMFEQRSGCFYHHTLVSLIHMLAVNGWDCHSGFFQKQPMEPWIKAVVYKSDQEPLDPKTTDWYKLAELGLLPDSANKGIKAHGYLRQQDLLLPWIDKSLTWMGQQ